MIALYRRLCELLQRPEEHLVGQRVIERMEKVMRCSAVPDEQASRLRRLVATKEKA